MERSSFRARGAFRDRGISFRTAVDVDIVPWSVHVFFQGSWIQNKPDPHRDRAKIPYTVKVLTLGVDSPAALRTPPPALTKRIPYSTAAYTCSVVRPTA